MKYARPLLIGFIAVAALLFAQGLRAPTASADDTPDTRVEATVTSCGPACIEVSLTLFNDSGPPVAEYSASAFFVNANTFGFFFPPPGWHFVDGGKGGARCLFGFGGDFAADSGEFAVQQGQSVVILTNLQVTTPSASCLPPLPCSIEFNWATRTAEGIEIDDGGLLVPCPAVSIEIDIKPGSDPNSITPQSRGTIPVAILSTDDFDAPSQVDTSALTFGPTGDEESLAFCTKSAEDVNGDGLLDQVCHFKTRLTDFQRGDTEGILRGQTVDGLPIEGRDSVRIVN